MTASMTRATSMSQARVVVIGGGVIGASVAYHLAKYLPGSKIGTQTVTANTEQPNIFENNVQRNVVLLERAQLTSGTSFHAAGLVGQLRSSPNVTSLLSYSTQLYSELEKEASDGALPVSPADANNKGILAATPTGGGGSIGWKQNGCVRLACTKDRMTEYKRACTMGKGFGVEMHMLSKAECQSMLPWMDCDDTIGGAYLPTDGQVNPSDLTMALIKGARVRGASIFENCPVDRILTGVSNARGIHVIGVRLQNGHVIQCDSVVNCCGQWSHDLYERIGVPIPQWPLVHEYFISEPIPELAAAAATTSDASSSKKMIPSVRDPDRLLYYKEEVGGLAVGGYEPNPIFPPQPRYKRDEVTGVYSPPADFTFELFEPHLDHFEPLLNAALKRVPALQKSGIKQWISGPESFTPDGNCVCGEAPNMKGMFVASGFNAFGMASAGGIGHTMASWVLNGKPEMDLWPIDIRRFSVDMLGPRYIKMRTVEAYRKHYWIAYPHEEPSLGRKLVTSSLYDTLKLQGAVFGSKSGWERPNWYSPALKEKMQMMQSNPDAVYDSLQNEQILNQGESSPTGSTAGKEIDSNILGEPSGETYSFCQHKMSSFNAVKYEHQSCRERCVVFDESSFAKFKFGGPDATTALEHLCTNTIAEKPIGSVIYTQMCNDKGGIECDLTVVRIATHLYYIITGTAYSVHNSNWINHICREQGWNTELTVITTGWGVLGLYGPMAKSLLTKVVDMEKMLIEQQRMRRLKETGDATIDLGSSLSKATLPGGKPSGSDVAFIKHQAISVKEIERAAGILESVPTLKSEKDPNEQRLPPKVHASLRMTTEKNGFDDDVFPYGTMQVIPLRIPGLSSLTEQTLTVRALRVSYVGECGWELHVPALHMSTVYKLLCEHGASLGGGDNRSDGLSYGGGAALVNAGYRAIESLRLEKGYRLWGSDIGSDYTPLEAGLSLALAGCRKKLLDMPHVNFVGKKALLDQYKLRKQEETEEAASLLGKTSEAPTDADTVLLKRYQQKHLMCFTVDPEVLHRMVPDTTLHGREVIYRIHRDTKHEEMVGWIASAGYGYTVEKYIGYGYVRRGFIPGIHGTVGSLPRTRDDPTSEEGMNLAAKRATLLHAAKASTQSFTSWLKDSNVYYELEVAGVRVPCTMQKYGSGPLYDPKGLKLKGGINTPVV